MIESNTENDGVKTAENLPGPTLLNSHTIVGEYFARDSLCPDDESKKLKKKLKLKRSGADGRADRNRSPVRRPADKDVPLHRVFADIMNADSCCSVLADGRDGVDDDDDGKYPKWQVNYLKLEDIIGPGAAPEPRRKEWGASAAAAARPTAVSEKTSPESGRTEPSENREGPVGDDAKTGRKSVRKSSAKKPKNPTTVKKPNATVVRRSAATKPPVNKTNDNSKTKKT